MSDISAKMVADLRAKTGAGLMACKKALINANGDEEAAIMALRKKGEAEAEGKANREAGDGIIEQYIHLGGKVGVLIELNCETDFVAKTDDFRALAKDICMHIAALNPVSVSRDEVPEDILNKEREVAAASAEGKPANIVEKIVEGKMNKVFAERCLLEQSFVKNTDQTIQDLITANIHKLGENIVVKRFARFQLGE